MRRKTIHFYRIVYQRQAAYALRDPAGYCLIDGDIFVDWDLSKTVIPEDRAKILAPVVPSKIIAVGLNYRNHAQELHLPLPSEPLIFLKPPTALCHPGDEIIYPASSQQVDFEGELAIIIGKPGKNIPETKAAEYILGYTLANDITARDLQKRDGQWTRAKGFDGFCPLGPCIATELEFEQLEFRTWLNNELKQVGQITQLIFNIPQIVAFVSQVMTLMPGDVILTGTPAGVGPMLPGDIIRIECEQIGRLENQIITSTIRA